MRLLQALTAFVESIPGVSRDSMESYADTGTLIPTGVDLGHGFEVGYFKYSAVISIEDFPARLGSLILPALMMWLSEADPHRDRLGLADPEVDIDTTDPDHVFIEISVDFKEKLEVIEDTNGLILWEGKRWSPATVSIDVAEILDRMEKC